MVVRIAFDTNPAAAAARYSRVVLADNPPWSDKERGNTVLFKTRVTCTGPTPAQVRVVGTLSSSAVEGGPFKNRASSDETRVMRNDGSTETFYTLREGAPAAGGSAYYRGTITATVVAPVAIAGVSVRERGIARLSSLMD